MNLWIALVLVLGVFKTVNGLQCYVCDECADGSLTDEMLKSCGVEETTTTTSTTTPSSSNTPSSSPTPSSSTTPSSTTPSSTTASRTTTPSTTTRIPAPNFIGGEDDLQSDSRMNRHIAPIDGGCNNCDGENDCECTDVNDLRIADNSSVTYVCMKTIYKVNTTEMVYRDCVPSAIESKEFCTFLGENMNITSCKTCETDKCNTAISLHSSGVTLLVMATTAFWFK